MPNRASRQRSKRLRFRLPWRVGPGRGPRKRQGGQHDRQNARVYDNSHDALLLQENGGYYSCHSNPKCRQGPVVREFHRGLHGWARIVKHLSESASIRDLRGRSLAGISIVQDLGLPLTAPPQQFVRSIARSRSAVQGTIFAATPGTVQLAAVIDGKKFRQYTNGCCCEAFFRLASCIRAIFSNGIGLDGFDPRPGERVRCRQSRMAPQ